MSLNWHPVGLLVICAGNVAHVIHTVVTGVSTHIARVIVLVGGTVPVVHVGTRTVIIGIHRPGFLCCMILSVEYRGRRPLLIAHVTGIFVVEVPLLLWNRLHFGVHVPQVLALSRTLRFSVVICVLVVIVGMIGLSKSYTRLLSLHYVIYSVINQMILLRALLIKLFFILRPFLTHVILPALSEMSIRNRH